MSGEKRSYVSVPSEELRRLRERESRLRSLQSDLPERLESIRRQAQSEMEHRIGPIEDRIRQQERDTRDMKGQIAAIVAEARRKTEAARQFLADLARLLSETDELPHGRFAPGKLDAIRRQVEDAGRNYQGGMPEASISTAQKAYWDIADLREDVLKRQKEFILTYHTALQEARSLLEQARANRRYQLELGQGTDKDVLALEVDHWTRGELSAYEDNIEALERQLVQGEDTLDTKETTRILADLEAMKPRLEDIVESAKENIIASQLRLNITELVVEALKKQGFTLEDAAYEGGDDRNPYIAKVKNIAGSEVVTVVSPVEGEAGKDSVSIHSYDETYVDEATLKQRADEIQTILSERGLAATEPLCAGKAKPQYRDIQKAKKARASNTVDKRDIPT